MPSSYEKGRSSEYYVKLILESMGYSFIIRSAASHTPIDLLASNGSEIIAVQVKARKYLSEDERRNLIEWASRFKAKPMLAYKKKGRWKLVCVRC
ncbi:MAG: restriction endonuclease [archaeon]|nr:restriction endonuclease [archaeon]MCP8314958.1 restriction endonuclease [archaeon]